MSHLKQNLYRFQAKPYFLVGRYASFSLVCTSSRGSRDYWSSVLTYSELCFCKKTELVYMVTKTLRDVVKNCGAKYRARFFFNLLIAHIHDLDEIKLYVSQIKTTNYCIR